jgi:hypothetical protein
MREREAVLRVAPGEERNTGIWRRKGGGSRTLLDPESHGTGGQPGATRELEKSDQGNVSARELCELAQERTTLAQRSCTEAERHVAHEDKSNQL